MVKTGIKEGEIQGKEQILTINSFLFDLSPVPWEFYVRTDLWGSSIMGRKKPVLKMSVWGSNVQQDRN